MHSSDKDDGRWKPSHKKGDTHFDTCACKKKHSADDGCVEDVLRKILYAQRKAKKEAETCCQSSCESAIKDILGKHRKVTKNTVPFLLYCGCEPYKGTGVATYSCRSSKSKRFKSIQSYIFRIKDLKGNCAVLELLAFKCDLKYTGNASKRCGPVSPCCQIDNQCVNDLQRTGVCITVDLSCMCSITCLPAIYL